MGWFFGFKLHLIINDKGEILNFMFTPGNADDREPLKQGTFLENIKGKLCADKGYIGQALFENLFLNGIQLVTRTVEAGDVSGKHQRKTMCGQGIYWSGSVRESFP